MNTTGKKDRINAGSRYFTLKHWQVVDLGGMLVLEGHLHKRFGYPEGIHIRTSEITDWYRDGARIFFHTVNSCYACSLEEYILDGDSLSLLNDPSLAGISNETLDVRLVHYADFIVDNWNGPAVLMNWDGCDCSYLKWTATLKDGIMEYEEKTEAQMETAAQLRLDDGKSVTLTCASSPAACILLPEKTGDEIPLYIENSGNRVLTVTLSGTGIPAYVPPGYLAKVS